MARSLVRVSVLILGGLLSPATVLAQGAGRSVADPATAVVASETAASQTLRDELDRLRREFDAVRRQYDERLLALEARMNQIGGGPAATGAEGTTGTRVRRYAGTTGTQGTTGTPQVPAPQVPAPQVPAPVEPPAAPPQTSKVFNPDISVIGNFIGVAGKNDFSSQPAMQLSEAEASFQAIVDPYARADFFIAAGSEGAEVEEGYITFTALPARLLLKVGKIRAQFGKVNTLHTHALPTADRPLVTENLVGGEEGLSDGGVSISHLINNPHVFLELTGEVYAGSSAVFQTRRDRSSRISGALARFAISPKARTSTSACRSRPGRPTSCRRFLARRSASSCSGSTRHSATGRCGARSIGASICGPS